MNRPSVNRQTVWRWPGGGQTTEDRRPPKSEAHDGNVRCRPYPRRSRTRCGAHEATSLARGEKSPALNGTRPKAIARCTAAAKAKAVTPDSRRDDVLTNNDPRLITVNGMTAAGDCDRRLTRTTMGVNVVPPDSHRNNVLTNERSPPDNRRWYDGGWQT
jgi:hypothetical protein